MTTSPGPDLLIVDDEAGIVEMLSIVFRNEGYRVTTARSCTEGLARLEAGRPDLVLTDVKMPDGAASRSSRGAASSRPPFPS